MKSTILTVLCLAFLLLAHEDSFAQNDYNKGTVVINPGLGLGYWYGGSGGFAVGFTVNAEFSITEEIAVGPYFAFTSKSYNYNGGIGGDYSYTYVDFGARGSYHFAKLLQVNNDKFDPYAGAFIGYVSASGNADPIYGGYYGSYSSGLRGGIFAGARWFFSDKFAAFGEVGVGLYPIVLGVTFKPN